MRRRLLHLLVLAALGAVALAGACAPFEGDDDEPDKAPTTADDAGAYPDDPGGLNTTGVGAGTGANTNLPCDVQQLLENRCIGCHLATSQLPLLTYDDLVKPSSAPPKNMAAMALERMQNTDNPMPPAPATPPTAEEIEVFKSWVGRNEPKAEASCTPPVAAGDAGVDAAIYDTKTVCTSNTMWSSSKGGGKGGPLGPRSLHPQIGNIGGGFGGFGNRGDDPDYNTSPEMAPGRACLTCHSIWGGPSYQVAGTVYPTAHEPDDCNGVNGGVEVIITDANGVERTLAVNRAGNFYDSTRVAAPFRVRVRQGTKERVMATALTAGDCNTCHTTNGANGAPGRVMAP